MKIITAEWSPSVNLLWLVCDCGSMFKRRADRWRVRCMCGRTAHLMDLREQYVRDGSPGMLT